MTNERTPTAGTPMNAGLPHRAPGRRRVLTAGVAVVAAVVILVGAYVATDGFHPSSGTSSLVLIPKGDYYSLPGGQFNAIAFSVAQDSEIRGTFTNTYAITLYTMTPAEVVAFSKSGVVGSYGWSSGQIANLSVTSLGIPVPTGAWDLVFLNPDNPSLYNTTIVGFYTDVTVSPS